MAYIALNSLLKSFSFVLSDIIFSKTPAMRSLFIICCIFIASALYAQPAKPRLTEQSIVKDGNGTIYPASIWKALLIKGAYKVKPIDVQNPESEFLLVKLTDEEKAKHMEMLPKPKESAFFQTGSKIKLFNTRDIDGNKLDLKDASGKILVFNFWFIKCSPCRLEIPDLNELVAQYKGNDKVQFIGVALDQKRDLKEFLGQQPFHYQIIDNGSFYTENLGIRSYPTHLVVDTEGKVYFHASGLTQNTVYWVKKSIDELLSKKAEAKP
jgi:thiol-disulfide isomerase/thioredoxin